MGEQHIVPLSTQAIEMFQQIRALSHGAELMFPNRSDPCRSIGPFCFNDTIRAVGYTGVFSPHGARALARTALNELGWCSDATERQLAHAERSKVRAAYNRAKYMEERRTMMQAWADIVDGIANRDDSEVTPIKSAAA